MTETAEHVEFKNEILFTVVNQFNVDDFARYTNFADIMRTIVNKIDLERCIKLNFEINIPNKALWMAGGFSSLKLTNEFYESDLAARIFRNIYGLRRCQVNLCACVVVEADFNPTLSKVIPLRRANKSSHRDAFVIYPDIQIHGTKVAFEKYRNELEKETLEPIESETLRMFRKSFYDHLKHIDKLFENYVTHADENYLSFDDFWNDYFRTKYNNFCYTIADLAPNVTNIKMEDPVHIIGEIDESDASDLSIIFVRPDMNDSDMESVVPTNSEQLTTSENNYHQTNYQQENVEMLVLASEHNSTAYQNLECVADENNCPVELIDLCDDNEENWHGKRSSLVAINDIPEKEDRGRLTSCTNIIK